MPALPPADGPDARQKIETVARVCREIDAHILGNSALDASTDARITLAGLSAPVGMSPHQLDRAFRSAMGITPRQYADAQRMRRLKSRLKKGDNVTTALYEAGYGSSSRLYERAPTHLGMTPAAYGRGGAGMQIRYAIVSSPFGRLLVGATSGASARSIWGNPKPRSGVPFERNTLARTFSLNSPAAAAKKTGSLGEWVGKILAHLGGQEPHLDLPTDVQATAFQRRVWEELRRIPYGTTRTYTEVARKIGQPAAIRAVARACATNPVSVVVPCHRVVRADGNLAGYRWGVDRKRALLQKELAALGSEAQRP